MTRLSSSLAGWLFASALALAAPAARAQGVVEQTLSNGSTGALYGRGASRAVFTYVTQRTSPTGAAETWLFVEISETDAAALGGLTTVLFGSGAIPAADLRTDGLGQLLLDTDTAANPSFTTYACPNPLPAEPPFCAPTANPGRVRAELSRAPGTPAQHQDGQWSSDYGNLLITQVGTGELAAATGEGAVGAFAFPAGASGTIGTTRDVLVVVQQGR